MASISPDYYCHKCREHIGKAINMTCPQCKESFIEEISDDRSQLHSQHNQRQTARIRVHRAGPFQNTRVFISSNRGQHNSPFPNDNLGIGSFFQTVLAQIVNDGSNQPLGTENTSHYGNRNAANFDAFLSHLLNQLGENGGPAPASENRINSIPTVRVTAEQAREKLQCTICLEEFKANDPAKRLPCSHQFHEECISRWLRIHGTCPTCRVTLDGDNTTNREYYNAYPNSHRAPSNHNRRNNGGSNNSNFQSNFYEFD